VASARPKLQEANASASIFFFRGARQALPQPPRATRNQPESLNRKFTQKPVLVFELSPAAAARLSQSARVYTKSPPKPFFFLEVPGYEKIGLSRLNPIFQNKKLSRLNPNFEKAFFLIQIFF